MFLCSLEPSTEYIIKLQAWDGKQYGKPATITAQTLQGNSKLNITVVHEDELAINHLATKVNDLSP